MTVAYNVLIEPVSESLKWDVGGEDAGGNCGEIAAGMEGAGQREQRSEQRSFHW